MSFLVVNGPFTEVKLTEWCVFFQDLKKYDAHIVVRVCEPTYSVDLLKKQGIDVLVSLMKSIRQCFIFRRGMKAKFKGERNIGMWNASGIDIQFCKGSNRFRWVGVSILSLISVFSCVCNANFWSLFNVGGKILLSYSDLLWFSLYSIIPINILIECLSNLHRNEHQMKPTTPI